MGEQIRVLRVIEYTGDRAAVEEHLKKVLYGERTFPEVSGVPTRLMGKVTIRAATVGPIPEVIKEDKTDGEG